jgi:hypothetical protein
LSGPNWTASQLDELADAEELVLVISRAERATLRFPVWMVVVDGSLYVRSYLGVTNGWYRAVIANPHQAIVLDGVDVDIVFDFVPATDPVNDAIGSTYLSKYARFDYRNEMVAPVAIGATLRILPAWSAARI